MKILYMREMGRRYRVLLFICLTTTATSTNINWFGCMINGVVCRAVCMPIVHALGQGTLFYNKKILRQVNANTDLTVKGTRE